VLSGIITGFTERTDVAAIALLAGRKRRDANVPWRYRPLRALFHRDHRDDRLPAMATGNQKLDSDRSGAKSRAAAVEARKSRPTRGQPNWPPSSQGYGRAA
jgi:hypothetical protein